MLLMLLSLLFVIGGACCLNVYRPDWIRLDSTTKERIDPLTEGEKTGGWMIFIGILLFVLSLI
jgi:hypothetical protein